MKITFIIFLFFIVILILPISFKLKVSYSVLDNYGSVGIYLFRFKIFHFIFIINKNTIIIKKKKLKKEIEIEFSNSQIRFLEQLFIQLKDKAYLKYALLDSKIGVGDAFNSAIVSAVIMNAFSIFFSIVKNRKKYMKIKINNFTAFNEKVIQLSSIIKFSISIFDILYSLLMSIVIIKRSDKYETI